MQYLWLEGGKFSIFHVVEVYCAPWKAFEMWLGRGRFEERFAFGSTKFDVNSTWINFSSVTSSIGNFEIIIFSRGNRVRIGISKFLSSF